MFGAVLGFALSGLLFFILHVTGSGSFPKPLSAQEEKDCLERFKSKRSINCARKGRSEHFKCGLRPLFQLVYFCGNIQAAFATTASQIQAGCGLAGRQILELCK